MSQKTAEHPPAESLLDFIRGALERAATERIGRHLAVCHDCREFVERAGDSSGDPPLNPPAATVAELPGKPAKPAKTAEPPVSVTSPTPKPTSVQVAPTPKPTAVQPSPPPPPKPAAPAPQPIKAEVAPPPPKPAAPPAVKVEVVPPAVPYPAVPTVVRTEIAAPPPKPAAPPAVKAEVAAPPKPAASPAAKVEAATPKPTAVPKPPAERNGDTPQVAQTMGPLPRIEVDGDEIPPELRDHPRYELRHKLGAGGMGVVFLAQHKVMERLVALKVLHQSLLATPETVERFRREARAAAKLDHPNIVKAFDAETVADWQILVMEFVEGRDLADATQHRGPFSVLHACNYAFQVAMGLQHAHEMNMVHRDLKPQNLMLTSKGVVKILDFGLAKLTAASPHQPGLTTKDVVIGTPEFIAPEQARDTASADIRSDIYSLGCTLYYFLTGEAPFQADTPVATVIRHLNDTPPRLESVRPDAPPEVCALYWRMMSKDPSKRPQTPLEVAEALRPFAVKPGTGSSSYDSVTLPPPEPVRTPYLKYALMFGLLLAAGAGAGVLLPHIMGPATPAKKDSVVGKNTNDTPGGLNQTGDTKTKPADIEKTNVSKDTKDDAAAKAEVARIEQEKKDAATKAEATRIEKEKQDAAAKAEAMRIEQEKKDAAAKTEAARIEQEKKDAAAKTEAARIEQEKKDAAMKAEATRVEQEKKDAAMKAEATRIEREKKEAERKKEEERLAAVAAEAAKMAREKEEAEKRAREPKALESLYELKEHRAAVIAAVFSQADKLMTTEDRPPPGAERASPILVWDIVAGNKPERYNFHYDRTPGLAVSPDGRLAASHGGIGAQEDLEVWDPAKKRNVFQLFDFPKALTHLTFSADGALLGAVNLEERVTVWSMTANGRQVRKKQAKEKNRESNPVTAVVLRADRGLTLAASGHKDGMVRLWSPVNEADFGSITKLHAGPVTALAFAPDGKHLVSVSADGGLRVTEGDKTIAKAETGSGLRCVAWTKNGKQLVTGGDDGLVRVWDAETGRELFRGTGHTGAVTCIAVAADNKTYASGGEDKSVRVWSLKAE